MATLQWATTGTVSGLGNNQQGNNIAQALATLNQNASAPTPSTTGLASTAGVLWHDTTNNQIKLRDQGDTTWMNALGVNETNKQIVLEHGKVRLTPTSPTNLNLAPYNGDGLKVNGKLISLAAGLNATNTSTFVSGVSGQALGPNGQYLVYVFDNGGTYVLDHWPLSAGHRQDTTAGNVGVEVRNNSGSPDTLRTLVGAVLTSPSGQYQGNSVAIIGFANWFNRRRFLSVSSQFSSSANTAGTATVLANSGCTIFQWSDAPEFDAGFSGLMFTNNPSFEATTFIGFDGTAIVVGSSNDLTVAGAQYNASFVSPVTTGSEAFHTVTTMGAPGTNTATWQGFTFAAMHI